jgi:hypothetical protein
MECDNKYNLTEGICMEVEIDNCLYYFKEKCIKCANQFKLSDKKDSCIISTAKNCLKYKNGYCELCEPGYTRSDEGNLCIKDNFKLPICSSESFTNDNCVECGNGRSPKITEDNEIICENIIIENCDTYQQNKCKYCIDGYIPSLDGYSCEKISGCKIANKGICTSCENGYYYNDNEKICIKGTFENCKEYGNSENICWKCEDDYCLMLDSNKCEIIDDKNCEIMEDGLCLSCKNYYILNEENKCVKGDIDHCLTYRGKICSACENGYYLSENEASCIKNFIQSCKNYDLSNDICNECSEGYILIENNCIKGNDNNCKKYIDDDIECEECLEGFELISGKCVEIKEEETDEIPKSKIHINYCEIYNQVTKNLCAQCMAGYTLSRDKNRCLEADFLKTSFSYYIKSLNSIIYLLIFLF